MFLSTSRTHMMVFCQTNPSQQETWRCWTANFGECARIPTDNCWWLWNPANQLRLVVYPHYLQGFIHPRWLFGISSINSRNNEKIRKIIFQKPSPSSKTMPWFCLRIKFNPNPIQSTQHPQWKEFQHREFAGNKFSGWISGVWWRMLKQHLPLFWDDIVDIVDIAALLHCFTACFFKRKGVFQLKI